MSTRRVWFAALLLSILAAGCDGGGGGGDDENDPIDLVAVPPTVTAVAPLVGATDVPTNTRIVTAAFSTAMDPDTLTTDSFTLACPDGTPHTGTVDYAAAGNVATLTLARDLPARTTCLAQITTAARDVAGTALAGPFVWTFTTGDAPDTLAPTVSSTVPTANATGVARNTLVAASFSEPMDPLTITSATILLTCPAGTPVAGTVGYAVNGNVATFTPASPLPNDTTCRATITTGVKDLAGNALARPYVWTFTTGPAPDTNAPTVISVHPADGATGVPINTLVTAFFSEPMNPLTITTSTIRLACPAGTPVVGTVGYAVNGRVATFDPTGSLPSGTTCTATITTGVTDVAGNALASTFTWTFTTGAAPDITAPTVIDVHPDDGAIAVAVDTAVSATFSEAMNPLTITTASFTLRASGPPLGPILDGTIAYDPLTHVATLTPSSPLAPATEYTATITTSVTDVAGNALVTAFVWTFTTGAAPDATAPTLILATPADLATDVALEAVITATFSEAMNPSTIGVATFTVRTNGLPLGPVLGGTFAYDPLTNVATFTPSSPLDASTSYVVAITPGAEDVAGNALAPGLVPNPWTFTTGTGLAPGAVVLGSAATFGIMATAAITSTGFSIINGDVSLDPGTSMTGFGPGVVNGDIHINDMVSEQARIDLLVGYNFAKALPPGTTIAGGADLGALYPLGMPPGTYTSGSTMLVSTPLVLDGGGNANAVWVFQIGSSLTTTASVSLLDGAQAKNVFWVPTQDATIGVGTLFSGTIISGRDVTAQTGTTINGRILAGAITDGTIALQTTTVNVPAQ